MPSHTQKSDSSASSTNSIPPAHLVSLPSLYDSLNRLPGAKSISDLSLHPSMLAQRDAESQAKLQKALSKSAANATPSPYGAVPRADPAQYNLNSPPPLMMRKSAKAKA